MMCSIAQISIEFRYTALISCCYNTQMCLYCGLMFINEGAQLMSSGVDWLVAAPRVHTVVLCCDEARRMTLKVMLLYAFRSPRQHEWHTCSSASVNSLQHDKLWTIKTNKCETTFDDHEELVQAAVNQPSATLKRLHIDLQIVEVGHYTTLQSILAVLFQQALSWVVRHRSASSLHSTHSIIACHCTSSVIRLSQDSQQLYVDMSIHSQQTRTQLHRHAVVAKYGSNTILRRSYHIRVYSFCIVFNADFCANAT